MEKSSWLIYCIPCFAARGDGATHAGYLYNVDLATAVACENAMVVRCPDCGGMQRITLSGVVREDCGEQIS